ncbi:MAG TPA: ankyrin repeat domain-containing protein [Pyrinomonadaceae bacterium]|jgi:redox-sensitive bicupin YhaK (pirin superfamily)
MKRTFLLDHVKVPEPCPADWAEMRGNERVRFCQHCSLHVHNLSTVTRPEAEKIIRRAGGRICVRYYQRPDGAVLTSEPLVQIQAGLRRASRLAAGAFSAALSLSAAVTAQEARPRAGANAACNAAQAQRADNADWQGASGGGGAISGTITDPAGAVIAKATVTVAGGNAQPQSVQTDDEGHFHLQLQPGSYLLSIESLGFRTLTRPFTVAAQQQVQIDETLSVGAVSGMVVVIAESALVMAVQHGDLPAVQRLLSLGSDVNALDNGVDKTALMEAVTQNNLELLHVLLGAGAQANVRNDYGQTALMHLRDNNTPELVRVLTGAGARLNLKDKNGQTALLYAAHWSNAEVVRTLIEAGAKVNAHNDDGETALMLAAADGKLENVKVLLVAGADVNRRDKDGQTAIQRAKENEHDEVVALLIAYGASDEPETRQAP